MTKISVKCVTVALTLLTCGLGLKAGAADLQVPATVSAGRDKHFFQWQR